MFGESRRHRPPTIGDVIRRAGDDRRLDTLGHRHQHRLRVRNQRQVAEHAAPRAAQCPEAVHRERSHRGAASGQPPATALAESTGDLEGDHDTIAGGKAVRPLDHLSHALVPEVDRHSERRFPEDHQLVEVARRDRQRPDDRLALVATLRLRNLVPGQPAGVFKYE
jgi:hypothetical protein